MAEKYTHHSSFCFILNRPIVVIDRRQEYQRGDGDVPGDEGERFCSGGRHLLTSRICCFVFCSKTIAASDIEAVGKLTVRRNYSNSLRP